MLDMDTVVWVVLGFSVANFVRGTAWDLWLQDRERLDMELYYDDGGDNVWKLRVTNKGRRTEYVSALTSRREPVYPNETRTFEVDTGNATSILVTTGRNRRHIVTYENPIPSSKEARGWWR